MCRVQAQAYKRVLARQDRFVGIGNAHGIWSPLTMVMARASHGQGMGKDHFAERSNMIQVSPLRAKIRHYARCVQVVGGDSHRTVMVKPHSAAIFRKKII
jgi:hypothetical protein